ncbi:MAG TPA: DUF4430 domain-containing protein, partial [Negativicutes bacterium]|nr:DUF4430 domain-containing protein [Negativicutes bacterium]
QMSGVLFVGYSAIPSINTNLSTNKYYYLKDETAAPLAVTVSASDNGNLSYQWYSSTVSASAGFTAIEGATAPSHTPSTATAETTYYYVIVTNTHGDQVPVTAKSATATVVVVPTYNLTVKFDGQELSGVNLQHIAETVYPGGLASAKTIKNFEIVSGTFTAADSTYLFGTLVDTNTNTGISVFFAGAPQLDVSAAFPNGISRQTNSKLFRLEFPGLKKIVNLGMTGTDGDRLPTLWVPDVETIEYTGPIGSFYKSNVTTLYLPNLKTIGNYAFSAQSTNTAITHLILPGNMPAVNANTPFSPGRKGLITVWAPAEKVNEYLSFNDGTPDDGWWYYCNVKALPTGVTDIQGFAQYAVDRLPATDAITPVDEEAILLARNIVSALPYSLAAGDLAEEVQKAYAAYAALPAVLLADIEGKIAALPETGDVTVDDQEQITGVWNAYGSFNPAFKLQISAQSVTRLNQVFSRLQEVLFDWQMANGTPFVSIDTLTDGTKRLNFGQTFAEFQYPSTNDYTMGATTYIGRGNFTAADFFGSFGYKFHSAVIASDEVFIDGGILAGDRDLSTRIQRLELPTITRMETHALKSSNYAPDWYLILPNIVSLDWDAYYDSNANRKDKAALYLPLMSKLEDCKTILRADQPLMLPRLYTGEKVFYASPQEYILLPSLDNAGPDFFKNAAALKAVWLPKVTKIDGGAFAGSSLTELYLGGTPPSVLGAGGLNALSGSRTVYVPDGAVNAYQAAADGNTTDNLWYGWEIKPFSQAVSLDDLLNYYLAALPEGSGISAAYCEWLGYLADARDSLTSEQQAFVNNAALDAALAAVASYASEDIANVESLIRALGDISEITIAKRSAVSAARAAYEALSTAARLQVENRSDLFAAELRLKELLLGDIQERIAAIPGEITQENITFIRGIYSDYLALNAEEKELLPASNLNKLNTAVDEVVTIEKDLIKAEMIGQRISALPPVGNLALRDEAEIKSIRTAYDRLSDRAKNFVGSAVLNTLAAAETRIMELKNGPTPGQKTVYVSLEKFTLGQGYIQTPIALTITEDEYPNVAAVIAQVIGEGNYLHTGSIANDFYLQAVKDNDQSPVHIPDYILEKIPGYETIGGKSGDWLSEFDLTSMSGWMYTVNNTVPLGASLYTYNMLEDGDVIRWQYSVYGYGADLGHDSFAGGLKFRAVANKDALTAEIAKVDASPEKNTWLENNEYAAAYAEAYTVIGSMTSTQEEVDACLAKLRARPATGNLGTVTVSVRDTSPRRQAVSTSVDAPVVFDNLSGLGNYQQPFGEIITNIEVAITPGMSVREAVLAALEQEGYLVTVASGRITGLGPLVTPDRSATVVQLAKDSAGNRSKWVLSLNDYAIADSEDAGAFYVHDGDALTLEYSVDGGYDVRCFPYTSTYFDLNYSVAPRLAGSGLVWDLYLPDGTEEIALSYTRQGPPAAPEQYNRYHKLYIKSNNNNYASNQIIPVTEGQLIQLTASNPLGAGGSVYTSLYDQPTGNGENRIINLTVKYLQTPADLQAAVDALPETEQLDYDLHHEIIAELMRQYGLYTQAEKDQLTAAAVTKLQAAGARMTAIETEDTQLINALIALVNGYYGKITKDNYESYTAAVEQSLENYEALNSRQKSLFEATVSYERMLSSKRLLERYAAGTGTIGIPTDYANDFLLSGNAFNLDLGKPENTYQAVFLDTPRIGGQGFHLLGRIQFEIKDPEIFEILAVPYTYVDNGLGGGGAQYPSVNYYLIPKKAGTTTFTATYDGFAGQLPEMAVHVNNPAESVIDKLADKLTNINALPRTTKYDTWHYLEGEEGAEFSFKVNGSNPKVYVYDYLSYEGSDAAKTEYPVAADGTVTVLLKDGYNPIEVTADYNGQRVTQLYGLKGKVISYELSNVTVPGATTFKEGDTVSLKIKGLATALHKMLRIYNPSATQFWYETNLPRYSSIKSGGGQYEAGEMRFVLTGSGEIVLRNGAVFHGWFGSPLFTEAGLGNQGGIAPQSKNFFSRIPDIHFTVAENPNYSPNLVIPQVTGGNTVQAGAKVTITLPNLDTASLVAQYQGTYELRKAFTVFETDIPGCAVKSKEAITSISINDLKTLEFTVPANTPAGVYHIYGGRVDMTYGDPSWLRYADCFVTEIDDLTITVTASQLYQAKVEAKALLEAYADPGNYRPTQQAELAAAIAAGKQAIEGAENSGAVAAALTTAKTAIDTIKTNAQLTAAENQAAAGTVSNMISSIGEVTLASESTINEARTAYNALSEAQRALVNNLAVLEAAEAELLALQGTGIYGQVQQAISKLEAYVQAANYLSDWIVVGYGNAGHAIPDSYLSSLAQTVDDYFRNTVNSGFERVTDHERRVLAIIAAGGDPRTTGGHNLIERIYNFYVPASSPNGPAADRDITFQGLNGVAFALIALDSLGYEVPQDARYSRNYLVQYLLNHQKTDGGWSLSGSGGSEADMTAMVLTALAPYQSKAEVRTAIDRAVAWLSNAQQQNGGYTYSGAAGSESISQVIIALCANGVDPTSAAFTKNGTNLLQALLAFQRADGAIRHTLDGSGDTGMSTEQGYQALLAYRKLVLNNGSSNNGQTSIYRFALGAPPLLQSAETKSGRKILLTFDKIMADPQNKQDEFTVTLADGSDNPAGNIAILAASLNKENQKIIELSLEELISPGQNVSVTYTRGAVASADGAALNSFTSRTVVNKVPPSVTTGNVVVDKDNNSGGINITQDTITQVNGPVNVEVSDDADAPVIIVSSLLSRQNNQSVSSALPALNISAATEISQNPVVVTIPQGTVITASSDWDGSINVPTVKARESVTVPAESGKTAQVEAVIEIGYGDIPLTFSQAVRILLPGQAGKKVGYIRGTAFTPISWQLSADSQAAGDALPEGGDGYLNAGADLVIWTKHFTRFVSYTQTDATTPGGDGGGGTTITVSFKLLGDTKHGTEGTGHVYKNNPGSFQTWIPATSVTVPKNSTVYDVFTQVLDDNGLQYDETQSNYIGGIKAPASFGGHWLYEFDNGPLSGWMYTVNGTHPSLGLRERVLRDGDIIVWHYTDDYTKEEGSEKWDNPGSGAAKTPVVSSGKEFSADRLKELREGNESLELQYGHLNISLNPQDLPVITDGKIKIETSLISETTALNSFFLAYPGLTGVLKGFSITLTEESSSGKTQPLTQLNGNIDLHF